jgi:hypothetical protein
LADVRGGKYKSHQHNIDFTYPTSVSMTSNAKTIAVALADERTVAILNYEPQGMKDDMGK